MRCPIIALDTLIAMARNGHQPVAWHPAGPPWFKGRADEEIQVTSFTRESPSIDMFHSDFTCVLELRCSSPAGSINDDFDRRERENAYSQRYGMSNDYAMAYRQHAAPVYRDCHRRINTQGYNVEHRKPMFTTPESARQYWIDVAKYDTATLKKVEKTMSQTAPIKTGFDGLLGNLKQEVCDAAMHGASVAAACTATDKLLVAGVRKLLGEHYPEFFSSSVGLKVEPILINLVVLTLGHGLKAYTSAALPFHDTVMKASRLSLEGKFRDLVQGLIGPMTALFTQVGSQLEDATPGA